MPNIVITEGLEKPWELADTETNITATTNLEDLNLVNQTVGQLAYASSQLLTGLKTEKDNLDKIVDAIESITAEIELFPERIAKWDNLPDLRIPDSAVGVIPLPLQQRDIATQKTTENPNLAGSRPINFLGSGSTGLDEEKTFINTLVNFISAKPLLDAAGVVTNGQTGYVVLSDLNGSNIGGDFAIWTIRSSIVEGTVPGSGGNVGDLVVYRNTAGQPISYENISLVSLVPEDPTIEPVIVRTVLNPNQVQSFVVPKDIAELQKWRETIQANAQIAATNSLINTTGLPAGAVPPVTTLGLSVEKYYDRARYSMTEYIRDGTSIIPTPNANVNMYGAYPPIQKADLDLSKMTTADVNKFYQRPGEDMIYYIAEVRTNGQVVVREASEFFGGVTKFIGKMTDDINKSLRSEYAEKQILLTQRSTDQTAFVTSITQRYTTFSDLASNLLKTLVNFYSELARNLRG